MKSLSIALKDMQLLLTDRGVWIYLLLVPLIFIFVFSGALAGLAGGGDGEDKAITLVVVNQDPGGELAQALISGIDDAGGIQIETRAEDAALTLLENREIQRMLIIPAVFSADIADGRQATARLVNSDDANASETEAVKLVVEGVVQDLALQSQLFASLEHLGAMRAGSTDDEGEISTEVMLAQAQQQMEQAEERPLVTVVQQEPGQVTAAEEGPLTNPIQITVPGFTVLFIFLTAQATARSIYDEKKVGSFRRLLAAPLSKPALLNGKMLPNFVVVLVQVIVIFGVAVWLLPLLGLEGLSLGGDPLALVPLTLLVALCSTGLGVLISAFAHTENQIGGLSTLLLWGMGLLGGAFLPTFLFPEFIASLAKVVPQYWAITAYDKLLVFNGSLADITTELAALLVFTVVFVAVGLWRFDFD
jgi:ABC-2 type transport system permease protein